ncbi:MAG: ImmA/IrrE family metallo-endopeptidase [Actinomycetes bacterium]
MTVGTSAPAPGARIAELMERTGVSADQVADRMMLDPDVPFERVLDGTYEPSPSELLGAADALDVPVAVLTGDLPTEGHLGVSLRMGTLDAVEGLAEPLGWANRMLDHAALLDSWLGQPEAPHRSLLDDRVRSSDSYAKKAGQVSADRLRAVLGLGDDDPVEDPVALLEGFGIPVAFVPMPEGVHGLNVRDLRSGGLRRVVLVSSAVVWAKQRYTLAHELCHALYDDDDQVIVDRAEVPDRKPEWRAEAFARHLLMPGRAVRAAAQGSRAASGNRRWVHVVAGLMMRFGVSKEATVIALEEDAGVAPEELAAVKAETVDEVMIAAGLLDAWRAFSEAQYDESGSPMLVERACRAYGEGWVRADLVADLLRTSEEEAQRALADAGWAQPVRG